MSFLIAAGVQTHVVRVVRCDEVGLRSLMRRSIQILARMPFHHGFQSVCRSGGCPISHHSTFNTPLGLKQYYRGSTSEKCQDLFPKKNNQRNTCKDETPTRLSHTRTKERTQEQQKGLKTCTFTETQIAQGVPEPHVSPSPSEQDVMFLGAILRSWDVLCSSCSRVPAKDSLVEHGVLSLVDVPSTSRGGCFKPSLVCCVLQHACKECGWVVAVFTDYALFLQVSCCGVRSMMAGCVLGSIPGKKHERTIMYISWTKPCQTPGCPISDDVLHEAGKNCTSDRSLTPAGPCAKKNQRSATVSVARARTTCGKSTFSFIGPVGRR